MTTWNLMRGTVGLAALMTGTAAMAQVTAQDVWNDWQQNFAVYGEGMVNIGSESSSGGTLTVSGLSFAMDDGFNQMNATINELTFTEQGDGTVLVTMSSGNPITVDGDLYIDMSFDHDGLQMLASGDPGNINYDLSANSYGVTISEIGEGNERIPGDMRFVMNDISGSYQSQDGNLRTITYALNAGSLEVVFDIANPDNSDERIVFNGDIAGLDLAAVVAMPQGASLDSPETLFINGFSAEGGYTFGAMDYSFDFNADGEQMQGTASASGGDFTFGISKDEVIYDVGVTGLDVEFFGNSIPFPVAMSAAEYGLNFQMPMSRTEQPADFAMGLALRELAVNDQIWGILDPQGILPRDPVTAVIDITGAAKLYYDILDPDQAEQMARADIPGELHSINLNDLLISAVGAEITGSGAFVVDNNTPSPGLGLPFSPSGSVTIDVNGLNALMDRMVQLGFVGQGEVQQARLMMGLFAVPTGDDALSSTLEINDQGHVLANGQRIQ